MNDRGGYTLKTVGGWHVEVNPMLFNYRVVLTPQCAPLVYEAGWCYQGTGEATLLVACAAALIFDPLTQADPLHYFKCVVRLRKPGPCYLCG